MDVIGYALASKLPANVDSPGGLSWVPKSIVGFTATGNRTMILLDDGRVASMRYNSTAIQVYDVTLDSWSALTTSPTTPEGFVKGVVGGKTMIFMRNYKTIFKMYDPVSNTWTDKALPPTNGLDTGTLMLYMDNGKILMVPNSNLVQLSIYDCDANTWSVTNNYPPRGFSGSAFCLLQDGRVFIAEPASVAARTSYIYDPVSDTWTTKADDIRMQSAAGGGTALVLSNGDVIVIGGNMGMTVGGGVAKKYDVGANAWSYVPSSPSNWSCAGTKLADGRFIISGTEFINGSDRYGNFIGKEIPQWSAAAVPTILGYLASK